MNKRIILDLDGVLVDFMGGLYRHFGIDTTQHPDVGFDCYKAVKQLKPGFNLSGSEFWKSLDHDFWAGLEWTPEGHDILTTAIELAGIENVWLATSDTLTLGCSSGKVEWIQRELPLFKRKYLIGSPKHLLARKGATLVDDRGYNCSIFTANGGLSVLVPRPWNEMKWVDSSQCGDLTCEHMEKVYNGK